MRQDRLLCDACGKEVRDQWFVRVESYATGNYEVVDKPEIDVTLDFCDSECLKEYVEHGKL